MQAIWAPSSETSDKQGACSLALLCRSSTQAGLLYEARNVDPHNITESDRCNFAFERVNHGPEQQLDASWCQGNAWEHVEAKCRSCLGPAILYWTMRLAVTRSHVRYLDVFKLYDLEPEWSQGRLPDNLRIKLPPQLQALYQACPTPDALPWPAQKRSAPGDILELVAQALCGRISVAAHAPQPAAAHAALQEAIVKHISATAGTHNSQAPYWRPWLQRKLYYHWHSCLTHRAGAIDADTTKGVIALCTRQLQAVHEVARSWAGLRFVVLQFTMRRLVDQRLEAIKAWLWRPARRLVQRRLEAADLYSPQAPVHTWAPTDDVVIWQELQAKENLHLPLPRDIAYAA